MRLQLDAEHRGPFLNLAAWITLVPMILFVLAKIYTKWKVMKVFQWDDGYMILATIFAIAQTINTVFQIHGGVGQHENGLSAGQVDEYQKTTYISEFFYLITIAFVKLASFQFLSTLTRTSRAQHIVKAILIFVAIWLVISILCVAFQCKLPSTWNIATGKCMNWAAFWTANAVVDILTQLLISFMPLYILFNLNMEKKRKRLAMVAFTSNLTTIPLIIIRLIYIFRVARSNKTDLTFTNFITALVSEIHTNYSIIAGCVPFMRPLVESLSIGLINNEIRMPDNSQTQSGSGSNPKGLVGKINPFGLLSSGNRSIRNIYGWTRMPGVETTGSNFKSTITSGHGKQTDDAVEMESRTEGSTRTARYGSQERMVINQTRTTEVVLEVK